MSDIRSQSKLLGGSEARIEQHIALLIGNLFPDNQVAAPGFILERDERDAARRSGPLLGNDKTGNTDGLP